MGAEVEWRVVYEISEKYEDWYYGVTAQEAMEACADNGPVGCKPLYAYIEDQPDVTYTWSGYDL